MKPRPAHEGTSPDAPTQVRPKSSLPVVLLVAVSEAFVARCRDVVDLASSRVEACSLASFKLRATALWPAVIVMPEALYLFDPDGFSEVAVAIGAKLLRVPSEEVAQDVLHALLLQAIFEAMPRRESFDR